MRRFNKFAQKSIDPKPSIMDMIKVDTVLRKKGLRKSHRCPAPDTAVAVTSGSHSTHARCRVRAFCSKGTHVTPDHTHIRGRCGAPLPCCRVPPAPAPRRRRTAVSRRTSPRAGMAKRVLRHLGVSCCVAYSCPICCEERPACARSDCCCRC